MAKIIVIVIAVLFVGVLGFAATKPDTFRIQRSTTIQAPPEKIFPLIDDFHSWASWSPYDKLDPAMTKTYSGAPRGKGAVYEWDGSDKVGHGRMEIAESSPPSRIAINLDFVKPFEAHNIAEFTLAPNGSSTEVTWAMHGPNSYVSKLMSVFISMDNLVGKDFESGLASLKANAEK